MKARDHKREIAMYFVIALIIALSFPTLAVLSTIAGLTVYCSMIFFAQPERRCRDCGHRVHLTPLTFPIIFITSLTCRWCGAQIKNRHR